MRKVSSHPRRHALLGALLWVSVIAGPVHAQSAAELERGRDLFWQALSLEVAGDWAGALSKLQQVAQVKITPQVRFHLARCKEQLGRLTEALGDYRLAEYEASKSNAVELGEIRQARQILERRVPRLVVDVSQGLRDATVELDGIALGDSRLGKATPTNPGDHLLVVRMPDGQSFVKRVTVAEASTAKVKLTAPPGFVYMPTRIRPAKVAPQRPSSQESGTRRVPDWAYVAGGIGAAGLVSASIFWYVRAKAIDELNTGCSAQNVCPSKLRNTQSRGEVASIAAPIALGIGVLGLGTAAYGIFLWPKQSQPQTDSGVSNRMRLIIDGDSQFAGVRVLGAF